MTTNGVAPPAAEPLDKLQSCVNTVLINIGRTFRDSSSSREVKLAQKSRSRSENISAANTDFHGALDEIEIELVRAREVFMRDLSTLRSARERQQALDASRQAAAPVPGVPTPVSMSKEIPPSSIAPETIMTDDLIAPPINRQSSSTSKKPSPPKPKSAEPNLAAPMANGLPAPSAAAHTTAATTAPGSTTTALPTSTIAVNNNNDSVNTADIDFDSMFADASNTDTFDLDFSSSSIPMDTSGDPFADTHLGADDFNLLGSGNGDEGEDINTLLPGLESYVNVDAEGGGAGANAGTIDDFAMLDLPGGDASGFDGNALGIGTTSSNTISTNDLIGGNDSKQGDATTQSNADAAKATDNVIANNMANANTSTQSNDMSSLMDTNMGGADAGGGGIDDDIFGNMMNDIGNGDTELGYDVDDWFNS